MLTAITLIIAVLGLSAWKEQLKGTKRFEASDKLISEILLTNVNLNRSFSLVNQFFTYPFDPIRTKLLAKQFYKSDFQMLTSEKEKLEELIVYAILRVKHMPKDTTAIVTSFSKILDNYQHFISMIDEQTPEYDFLEDKNNFAKSNLDKHVKLSYDYINAIKL